MSNQREEDQSDDDDAEAIIILGGNERVEFTSTSIIETGERNEDISRLSVSLDSRLFANNATDQKREKITRRGEKGKFLPRLSIKHNWSFEAAEEIGGVGGGVQIRRRKTKKKAERQTPSSAPSIPFSHCRRFPLLEKERRRRKSPIESFPKKPEFFFVR